MYLQIHGRMVANMKQTEYMKGWSHAGWLLVIMTAIMFLFFIFVGECSAQVQNQHLAVIAKKNSGSAPAGDWVQVLIDTSFEDRTAFGSEWFCNANRWTYDGTNNELDFDNTGAEGFHQDSIQVVGAGGTDWDFQENDSLKLQYGIANTAGSGMMFKADIIVIESGVPATTTSIHGYGQRTDGVYEYTIQIPATATDGYDRLAFLALSGYEVGSFTWIKLWKKEN